MSSLRILILIVRLAASRIAPSLNLINGSQEHYGKKMSVMQDLVWNKLLPLC